MKLQTPYSKEMSAKFLFPYLVTTIEDRKIC